MICDLAPKAESSSSSSQDTGVKGTARVKTKREAVLCLAWGQELVIQGAGRDAGVGPGSWVGIVLSGSSSPLTRVA